MPEEAIGKAVLEGLILEVSLRPHCREIQRTQMDACRRAARDSGTKQPTSRRSEWAISCSRKRACPPPWPGAKPRGNGICRDAMAYAGARKRWRGHAACRTVHVVEFRAGFRDMEIHKKYGCSRVTDWKKLNG